MNAHRRTWTLKTRLGFGLALPFSGTLFGMGREDPFWGLVCFVRGTGQDIGLPISGHMCSCAHGARASAKSH